MSNLKIKQSALGVDVTANGRRYGSKPAPEKTETDVLSIPPEYIIAVGYTAGASWVSEWSTGQEVSDQGVPPKVVVILKNGHVFEFYYPEDHLIEWATEWGNDDETVTVEGKSNASL